MKHSKILVVEDEAIVASDIRRSLTNIGYEIPAIAGSAHDAIHVAEEIRPDLVLMDIKLTKDMDGIEAAESIRKSLRIPIVFLTAYADQDTLKRAKLTDPFGYIIKPFNENELHAVIEMAIYKYEIESALEESEEKFRIIAEQAIMGIAIIEDDMILYVNNQFCEILCYNESSLLDHSVEELQKIIHPGDRDFVLHQLRKKMKGEKDVIGHYSYRIVDGKGVIKWVDHYSKTIRYRGSNAVFINIVDITKQKAAEETLKESEEHYRLLVENTNDVIFSLDQQGLITYVSPVAERVLGYKPDEIVGGNYASLVFVDDLPGLQQSFQNTLSGKIEPYEFRMHDNTGSLRWFRSSSCVVLTDGKPTGITGILTDITEKKEMEGSLRRERDFAEKLIRNSPALFVVLDPNAKVILMNPTMLSVLGYTSDEVLNIDYISKIVPEREHQTVSKEFFSLVNEGKIIECRNHILARNGREILVQWQGTPIFSTKGCLEFFFKVGIDITERDRMDAELKKAYRAREELEQIVNESEAIVFLWRNAEGWPVEYVSNNIRLYGYAPRQLYAGDVKYAEIIHPDDLVRVTDEVKRYSEEGRSIFSQEYRIVTKRGDTRWVDDRTLVRRDNHGNITHYQGIILDITERKKTGEALRESEVRFREIAEFLPETIAEMDLKGNLTYVNRVALEVFGYSEDDFKKGLNAFRMIVPEERDEAKRQISKVMNGERTGPTEYTAVRKNGSRFPVFIHSNAIIHSGKAVGIRSIITDITTIKSVEEELQQMQEFQNSIVENIPDMVFVKDAKELRYLMVNKAGIELLGYPREALIDKRDQDLYPKEKADILTERDRQVLKNGRLVDITEELVETQNKGKKILQTKRIPVIGENGEPQYLLGISEDVTESKKAADSIEIQRDLGTVLSIASSIDEALPFSLKAALEISGMDSGGIYLIDKKSGCLNLAYSQGFKQEFLRLFSNFDAHSREVELTIKGIPVYTNFSELETTPCEVFSNEELCAIAVIPIYGESENVGALIIASHSPGDIPINVRSSLESVASHIGGVIARLRAEEALRESLRKNEAFLRAIPDMIFVISRDGKYVDFQASSDNELAIPRESIIGKHIKEAGFSDYYIKLIQEKMKIVLATGQTEILEYELTIPSGLHSFEARMVPLGKDQVFALVRDITERKNAEAALKGSEEKLMAVVETANQAIISANSKGCIIAWNKAAEHVFGFSREEMIGKSPHIIAPERFRDRYEQAMNQAIRKKQLQCSKPMIESVGLRKDGSEIPIEISFTQWESGGESFFTTVISDITERKKAEKTLRESEEKHRLLLNSIQSPVLALSKDMSVFYCNQAYLDFVGRTREEVEGKKLVDLFPQFGKTKSYKAYLEAIKTGEVQNVEGFMNERCIQSTIYPMPWGILAIAADITQRVDMENQIRDERDKAQSYLDVAGVMLLVVGSDQEVKLVNKKGYEILGYTEEEILHKNWFDNFIPKLERDKALFVFNVLMDGKSDYIEYHENHVLTSSGMERLIAWHNNVLKDDMGVIIGSLSSGEDITEQREAEIALRESEERYRILTEEALIGIYIFFDGRYIFVNRVMEKITGYSKEELLAMELLQNSLPGDRNSIEKMEGVKISKSELSIEYTIETRRKNGEIAILDVRVHSIPYGDRNAYLGNCIDVTERVHQAALIEHAKKEWERTFDAISDIVMIVDPEGRLIRVNRSASEYSGLGFIELKGKIFLNVFHTEDSNDSNDFFINALKSKIPASFEIKDPKEKHEFWVSISPLTDPEGNIIASVCVARDITNTRRMEQALIESETHFRGLAESAKDIIFNVDEDGSILYTNPAVMEIMGYDQSKFVGINIRDLMSSHTLGKEVRDIVRKYIKQNKHDRALPLFEVEIPDAKGRKHILEFSIRQVMNQIIGIARDVTQRNRIQEQLTRASKLASMGVLAGGLAHQINNPLASILATSTALNEMLKKDPQVPKEVAARTERYLEKMEEQVDRTHRIVSGLLEFAKEKSMDVRPVDVNGVIRNSLQFLSQHLSFKEISLDLFLEEKIPKAMADRNSLEEALVNVIQNAYEAMEGKGKLIISTRCEKDLMVQIHITNDGPPIPSEYREEIFELLFSTKTGRKGTGLGLPVAAMLLEHSCGKIYLEESIKGKTTFVIEIPLTIKEEL